MRGVFTSVATVLLTGLLAACAAPRITPSLDPGETSAVWPSPPETPRYAYVRDLIGERDFIDPSPARDVGREVFEFIVGMTLGGPNLAELQRPNHGMMDDRGRMLVTDVGRAAVVLFDFDGQRVETWTEAAPGVPFLSPVAIVGDGAGGYWVSDTELSRLVHLSPDGEPLGTLGEDTLERPTGLARDAKTGTLYVTDTGTHRIVVFNRNRQVIDVIGGRGTEPGQFNYPTHLAVHDGKLYVADTLNFRIQVFDLDGDGRLTFGRLGFHVGNMTRPKGVAVGGDGRIYVIESYFDHLLVFDPDGRLLLPIGGTGTAAGKFYLPSGVWTDSRGNVYVADMFNGRISVFRELTRGVFQ